MTARIKSWSSRNLSFAGRITLINSVLVAIQAYWSQMMILPKKVLRSIEAHCRAFLWKGQSLFHGAGSVAWNNVCQPKAAGGLGIKNLEHWNKAAIYGYNLFHPSPNKQHWSNEVWGRFNTPKHSVILWLAILNRLKTKDRVSNHYLTLIKHWLNWKAHTSSLPQLIKWIGRAKISNFRKKVLAAVVATLVYSLWKARTELIWQQTQVYTGRLIDDIQWILKNWINMLLPRKIKAIDRDWFGGL
uniref:Reverse transcriptase zinc-binding domain-containing protein n=1 Tax=Cannabis sativa TaxID=3483 RepID=A0A803Q1D7_CANSA